MNTSPVTPTGTWFNAPSSTCTNMLTVGDPIGGSPAAPGTQRSVVAITEVSVGP